MKKNTLAETLISQLQPNIKYTAQDLKSLNISKYRIKKYLAANQLMRVAHGAYLLQTNNPESPHYKNYIRKLSKLIPLIIYDAEGLKNLQISNQELDVYVLNKDIMKREIDTYDKQRGWYVFKYFILTRKGIETIGINIESLTSREQTDLLYYEEDPKYYAQLDDEYSWSFKDPKDQIDRPLNGIPTADYEYLYYSNNYYAILEDEELHKIEQEQILKGELIHENI